jgi:imidazolonepropionase-like amidohydrolase
MSKIDRRQIMQGAFAGAGLFVLGPRDAQAAPKPKPKRKRKKKGEPAPRPGRTATAIVGATLLRGETSALSKSVVVFEHGVVTYVGTDPTMAGEARVIRAEGKILSAGLVDPLTRIGLTEVSLESSTRDDQHTSSHPIRAAFRAADGYNPVSSLVRIARREGLTSVGVVPSGGLVTGQSAWADLAGGTPARALGRESIAVHVRIHDAAMGAFAGSRGSAWLGLRQLLDDSLAFRANRVAFRRRNLRRLGATRLDYKVMVRVLDGELPLIVHVDRASDIMTALELAKRYDIRIALASAAEAWKVRRAIALAKVPVIVYPLDEGPRSFAALGAREDNAALLHRAGVVVALSVGDSHHARKLRQAAGNAIRAGLPKRAALAAVSDVPAKIYGLDALYGTPRVGRRANLVLWTADPFELSSHAERVFIRGRQVSLKSRQTALYERYAK